MFGKNIVFLLKADINPLLNPFQYHWVKLFADFSSAFDNLQLLIQKIKQMSVNSFIIKWYLSFLTDYIQHECQQYALGPKTISIGLCELSCVAAHCEHAH